MILLAPGQGSQAPGLLTPWLDQPGAREDLAAWSELTGLDLLWLGTGATAEQIRDTAIAQPLLTAAALLSARALTVRPDAFCGHSVGEIPILALAGVLDPGTAVWLAAFRGRAMADASAQAPTGMCAVLGGDPAQVREAATRHGLDVAIVNAPGQVVLGGALGAVDALATCPPTGSRVRRLQTAGAFHTSAMQPAVPLLAEIVAGMVPSEARAPVIANADGAVLTDGRTLLNRLVGQLTGPVRFDACLQSIAALGATRVVELAPAGTLAAIVTRTLPDVAALALRAPADAPVSA